MQIDGIEGKTKIMSDDLISRKTLLDELDSLRIELNGISCRKEFKKTVKEVLDTVKHLIEDQPTAFDKEKVIEDLQEAGQSCNEVNDICGVEAIEYAIEIVEKGGIE